MDSVPRDAGDGPIARRIPRDAGGRFSSRLLLSSFAAAIGAVVLFAAPRAPVALLAACGAVLGVLGSVAIPALAAAHLITLSSFLSGVAFPVGGLHIRPEQVVAPVILAGCLLRRSRGFLPREGLLVALWILAGLCGSVGEPSPERALLHTVRLSATVLPFFLLPLLLPREEAADRGWNGFLVLASLEACCGLLAWVTHHVLGTTWGITSAWGLGYVHPHGTLLEPNLLGALSAASAIPLVVRSLGVRRSVLHRLAAAGGALLLGAATAVSLTRAAWIALPGVLALVLALRWLTGAASLRQLRRRALVLAGALAAGLLGLLLLVLFIPERQALEGRTGVMGKIASLRSLAQDPNVRVRVRSYEEALRTWRSSPLFGAGHGAMERLAGGEDKELAWAGNLEVHLLVDTGLVGLSLFAAMLLRILWLTVRGILRGRHQAARDRGLERLGALLVLLLCAQATETSWLASLWVVLGLSLAGGLSRGDAADDATDEPATDSDSSRPPLRILYVHPSDELYGSDRVLLDLIERLDRRRFVPLVLLSSDVPYAGRLSRRLAEQGVAVRRMRIGVLRRRVLTSPLLAARYTLDVAVSTTRITALLLRERIDLVHANTVTVFPAAVAARLARRRLVWHLHEIVTARPGRGLLHALVRLLAHRIVVVSEAARQSLGKAGADARVVFNGVAVRPLAAAPDEPPVVAYIGRLSLRKGPHVLLHAAARVLRDHPDVRFLFAGDEFGGGATLRRELEAEAERLEIAGALGFRPFTEDVSPLLAQASIVVSPSILPESFGLILLEAMAFGRPVVASAHGGPSELIVDGETGLLVPARDEEALATALDRLLRDRSLRQRLGSAGRTRAQLRFPLQETVRRFEALYDELDDRPRR
ncbi:MAG: glycosyltransferase [Thermoanaerobaculia bacterium]